MSWAWSRRALAAADVLWTASLVVAAYAASHAGAGAAARLIATVDYAVGSIVCHQRPERSFHLWGAQLPVCARCTGIYAGAIAGALLPLRGRIGRAGWFLALAASPALASLAYEWIAGSTPSNMVRAATGVLLGAAVMIVLRGELRSGEVN